VAGFVYPALLPPRRQRVKPRRLPAPPFGWLSPAVKSLLPGWEQYVHQEEAGSPSTPAPAYRRLLAGKEKTSA